MNYYIITGANSELAKAVSTKLREDNNKVLLASRRKLWCAENISSDDFLDRTTIPDTKFKDAKALMESNFLTLYGVIKYLLPLQLKRGGGKIVAFSCNSVKYNYPGMSAFTSAKAAVESLVKITANEWAHENIIINAFSLPSIKTDAVLRNKPDYVAEDLITPKELSECIINEVDNFSKYTNGNIISIIKHSDTFFGKGYYERNKYSLNFKVGLTI